MAIRPMCLMLIIAQENKQENIPWPISTDDR